jgi:hypothetical protein
MSGQGCGWLACQLTCSELHRSFCSGFSADLPLFSRRWRQRPLGAGETGRSIQPASSQHPAHTQSGLACMRVIPKSPIPKHLDRCIRRWTLLLPAPGPKTGRARTGSGCPSKGSWRIRDPRSFGLMKRNKASAAAVTVGLHTGIQALRLQRPSVRQAVFGQSRLVAGGSVSARERTGNGSMLMQLQNPTSYVQKGCEH